jgi:hypothetical protein
VGLPPDRRRAKEARCHSLGDERAECVSTTSPQTGPSTIGTDLVAVPSRTGCRHASGASTSTIGILVPYNRSDCPSNHR